MIVAVCAVLTVITGALFGIISFLGGWKYNDESHATLNVIMFIWAAALVVAGLRAAGSL